MTNYLLNVLKIVKVNQKLRPTDKNLCCKRGPYFRVTIMQVLNIGGNLACDRCSFFQRYKHIESQILQTITLKPDPNSNVQPKPSILTINPNPYT